MFNVREKVRALQIGLSDGWNQPQELTAGMTYADRDVSGVYDRGVNLGQAARIFSHVVCAFGGISPEDVS